VKAEGKTRTEQGDPRPRVGMALYGDLTYDSRVRREAMTLTRAGFDVVIACLAGEGSREDLPQSVMVLIRRPAASLVLPGVPSPFIGPRRGRLISLADRVRWLSGYVRNLRSWGRAVVAATGPVDIWHLHDLTGLTAVAPFVARDVPIVYDAHELFLETGSALRLPRLARSAVRAYEHRLVSRVAAVITVNEALAEVLRRRYQPRRVEAIHNCPDRWSPPTVRPTLLRDATGANGDPIILYHGALSANRGIEQLMAALLEPGLHRAHLALVGFGEKRDEYVTAALESRWHGRVHVLDPVSPGELLPWVASADLGAMPIQASTLNHYLSTPNKLFECLAAGTPVVTSAFPQMTRIVVDDEHGPLGAVCDPSRVDHVARALRSILELDPAAARELRRRCAAAAQDRWNWEAEGAALARLYTDLSPRSRALV
jgi:glycosyltransferase involved in cell wall biosynthesis